MKQYLDLVQTILEQGSWQSNRTGVRTLSTPGAMMRFDLQAGFPAITTRKLAFKSAIGELVGFLRASSSAADFRALGCRVWDQNANENAQWLGNPYRSGTDDLGPVYGVQWRSWPAYKLLAADSEKQITDAGARGYRQVARFVEGGTERVLLYRAIDQLRSCLDAIVTNPLDRRILFHGWNCAQLDEMALPPCHLLYHFLPNASKSEISLCLYVRSNDIGLGAPFNIAEGAALLSLVGRLSGLVPRWLSYFIGDAHIYENHLDMLNEQLRRTPHPLPRLVLSDRIPDYALTGRYEPEWLDRVEPADFQLQDYRHHPSLTAPMAV
ncbi:thymidylate synthase [Methylococcus sp. EFPC2]|uniref:thymidylate synthase n=1 Tax=Methylococcus sp. EFPC2 TaxID=2812648 RepID=UPI001967C64D|nr:thymidylate synthase [Methylococcus sp. EFPC2]QSA96226.1 thymidylate synthase [Methylococcus sp. EFPC2]